MMAKRREQSWRIDCIYATRQRSILLLGFLLAQFDLLKKLTTTGFTLRIVFIAVSIQHVRCFLLPWEQSWLAKFNPMQSMMKTF